MPKLPAISLFTGIGGLDYGFEAAGFSTAVAVEFDRSCAATLQANRDWAIIEKDIARISGSEVLRTGGIRRGEAAILIGGPPCQPFSKSSYWANGDSDRLHDPRAGTLRHYLRILGECLPQTFLLENVEGLGFKGKDEGVRLISRQLKRINAKHGTNYAASVAVLNAADYGVPQSRRRLFIVGAIDGTQFRFPFPTHSAEGRFKYGSQVPYLTAWDALHDLREPRDPDLGLRGKWADLLPSIPEGHNYLWHTDRGGGEPLFGWRTRYWSFLLKLAKARPSWTLQAQPGPATGPFHWTNRRLSVREMARLQTFPDRAVFLGSYAEIQRQIGNAVPSRLAEVLAREISKQFFSISQRGKRPVAGRGDYPPPDPTMDVPLKYLSLRGRHRAHPGAGSGRRAILRWAAE